MQNLAPVTALDQIPGTRTTKRIAAALLSRVDAHGVAQTTRRELAELLRVTETTIRILVGRLQKFGLVVRYGRNFVFRLAARLRAPETERAREDGETEIQALGAFVSGRSRAGAAERIADLSSAPLILTHARSLAIGALRGVDVMQIARLMGQAYVEHAATPNLTANNFPLHPRWIGPALDAISRGALVLMLGEKRRASERREAREHAREALAPSTELAAAFRRGALDLLGALS